MKISPAERRLLEGRVSGVLLTADGTILLAGPPAKQLLGNHREPAAAPLNLLSMTSEKHRPELRRVIEQSFRGEGASLTFAIEPVPGARRPIEIQTFPWRDKSGAVAAVLGRLSERVDGPACSNALAPTGAPVAFFIHWSGGSDP